MQRTPVYANRAQSDRRLGRRVPRAKMMPKRIADAIANRMPANVSGGRSRRPSLIANQVEPQIPQRDNHTIMAIRGLTARAVPWFRGSTAGARKTVAARGDVGS